jgi:type I site-specific restriction-modification system R (restriction) subunit
VLPVLGQRPDVMVFTDEAHRSQYDTLALNMRAALPKPIFVAFTGPGRQQKAIRSSSEFLFFSPRLRTFAPWC